MSPVPPDPNHPVANSDGFVEATRAWIERAVIGLNLCPFAKAVYVREQIRYVVSEARTPKALLADLEGELTALAEGEAAIIDTTLLIHPHVLGDFFDYNDFLDVVDEAIDRLELDGDIQVASFHPDYQFADTSPDDPSNYTNRSPYPMLHLLREASIERAVDGYPDTDQIHERNIETMRRLGAAGIRALFSAEGPAPGQDK